MRVAIEQLRARAAVAGIERADSLVPAVLELDERLTKLEASRSALHWQISYDEAICGVALHPEHARAAGDTRTVTCPECLAKLTERGYAPSLLADHVPAPASVAASAAIALCAVVLDEADGFFANSLPRSGAFDVHAQRCRALYTKLCANASAAVLKERLEKE